MGEKGSGGSCDAELKASTITSQNYMRSQKTHTNTEVLTLGNNILNQTGNNLNKKGKILDPRQIILGTLTP
jgi:hypothetical protein